VKFGLTKLETETSLICYHVLHKIFQYTETDELFKHGFTNVTDTWTDRQTDGRTECQNYNSSSVRCTENNFVSNHQQLMVNINNKRSDNIRTDCLTCIG